MSHDLRLKNKMIRKVTCLWAHMRHPQGVPRLFHVLQVCFGRENPSPLSLGYGMCQLIMSVGGQDLLPGSPAECALRSGSGVTNGWPLWLGESTDSIFRQGCSVGSLTRQGCWLCSMVTWGISCALQLPVVRQSHWLCSLAGWCPGWIP